MKSMLPAAVFCLVFGLLVLAVTSCDQDKGKKLGDVSPWGSDALNQIAGPSSKGDILVSDGTNWHLKSIGTAGQVLTVTTNANAYYVEWK
jgi:hypothetical protein